MGVTPRCEYDAYVSLLPIPHPKPTCQDKMYLAKYLKQVPTKQDQSFASVYLFFYSRYKNGWSIRDASLITLSLYKYLSKEVIF